MQSTKLDTCPVDYDIPQEDLYGDVHSPFSTSAVKRNSEKNPAAVLLGRLGGLRGGNARAAKLSPQQRSEIARKAAVARWSQRQK